MAWWKSPQWGWLLHLLVSIAPILINIAIAYVQDPSNPLGLQPTVLGLVITGLNVILSQIRNGGQTVATLAQDARTYGVAPDLASGQQVIIRKP